MWIQIYHLPIELWSAEILEQVTSQFGRVLKVDDHTINHSRPKFAHIRVELDLEQLLQPGTWVKYGGFSNFVLVLYEKIPIFCYRCGKIRHDKAHCSSAGSLLCPGKLVPLPMWRWSRCKLIR